MGFDHINNEDDGSLIERHREFANWSHIIRNTVNCWGTTKDDAFYYGINGEPLFNEFEFAFNGTLSTSSEYMVTYLYSNSEGLILKLMDNDIEEQQKQSLSYFACDWISDVIQEKERLFINCTNIKIANITNSQFSHDYFDGIKAIKVIQRMIGGKALKTKI